MQPTTFDNFSFLLINFLGILGLVDFLFSNGIDAPIFENAKIYYIVAQNTLTALPRVGCSSMIFDQSLFSFIVYCKLLFWGDPGTGKTAFAHHLAKVIGTYITLKRASDLLSMWVGETEKSIRATFEEAETDESILLIDEADSFLQKRDRAHAPWTVTQTNELLTQIEAFTGILICCTNMLDSLDSAVLRRFAWKVEFCPLDCHKALRLIRAYFPDVCFSSKELTELSGIDGLTPGDVFSVWEKAYIQPDQEIDAGSIIQLIRKELRYKNKSMSRRIGFC